MGPEAQDVIEPAGAPATGGSPSLAAAEKLAPPPSVGFAERFAGKGKQLWSRVRASTLAIVGGAFLIGSAAIAWAIGATSRPAPPAVAMGASIAGSLAGVEPVAIDAGSAASADVADDAAAPRPTVWRVSQLSSDADVKIVGGVLGHHPLLAALGSAGLSRSEAQRVVRSLAQSRDVDRFDPKDSFTIAFEKESARVVAYEVATSPTDVWQGRETTEGGAPTLAVRKLELFPEQVRVKKSVVVGADLRASFADAGLTPIDDVLTMLDDALDGHAELSDIRPGSRLRLVATQERVGGEFVRWSSLDAVEYFPAAPNAPSVRVYRFDAAGEGQHGTGAEATRAAKHHGWFDAKGKQPYSGGFRSPVPLARIASRFNPHRMHPVLHVVMPHNGVDFAAPTGAPVYATAAGVVTSVGPEGPCGNKVEIAHTGGYASVYCHLSRFAPGLRVGQHVEARQLIAYVGQTGRVTGPHLHFGMKRGGVFIDPMTLRFDGVRVVPRSRRDDFDRVHAELDAELDTIPLPPPGAVAADSARPSEPEETIYEEP